MKLDKNMEQGLKLMNERRYEEAARAFDQAIERDPVNPVGYTNFGNLLIAVQQPERSLAFFEKALQLDPEFASAAFGYGNALFEWRSIRKRWPGLKRPGKPAWMTVIFFYMIGLCCLQLEQSGRALAAFQRAVELNASDTEARFQYGLILAKLGQIEAAEKQLGQVLKDDGPGGRHADAYYNLGVIAMYKDDAKEASRCFEEALKRQSGHMLAAHALAELKKRKEEKH
ncbi:tetratricopeptide repeat protein [Terrilactibacillus sp. S3-3]|nr:tetratricopeptide repeat protein [Terrilactibacillus sp. S3-3]